MSDASASLAVMYLGVHPVVDPLRQNPRFQALVRKMGLESIRLPH